MNELAKKIQPANRIEQLNEDLINKIAAGEVIDRPCAIVKELVENSIDAGSTKIEIKISNETRNIRVADNGCGIDEGDIQFAFKRHATSKIKTLDDLWNISTLGFRGEALASIVAVAKVTCTTRTKTASDAIMAVGSDSVIETKKVGAGFGTTFEVKDLFFNTPARLKFLKSSKTEFAYIQETIQAIALSNPNIAFELFNNEKSVLKTTGTNDLQTVIYEIFGISAKNNLVEINKSDLLSKIKITGICSTPDYTRPTKKNIYIFVNGRTVKCPVILKSIDTAYKRTLPIGKYPFVVLNVDIPYSDVDVNVHPTKRELRYKNPNQIFNIVYSAIDMAISNFDYNKPKMDENILPFDFTNREKEVIEDGISLPYNNFSQTTFSLTNREFLFDDPKEPEASLEQNASEPKEDTKPSVNYYEYGNLRNKNNDEPKAQSQSFINETNVIGQYADTYILIEHPDGLEIVDQHIAHERYLYEQLLQYKDKNAQILLISEKIDISPEEVDILNSNKDILNKYGYNFEITNGKTFMFKKLPQKLTKVPHAELLQNILEDFQSNAQDIENQIITTIACKSAVKANTRLNIIQMKELIDCWRKTKNPHTCPHGRPISVVIPHKKIAGMFLRNA